MEIGLALGAVALAAVLTLVLIPVLIPVAWRCGLVDHPRGRHAHERPTPLMGAVPTLVALAVICIMAPIDDRVRLALIAGVLVMLVVGLVDDRRGMSPLAKLTGQAVALAIPVLAGLGPGLITLPGIGGIDLGAGRAVAWILWGLVIINALNLIDGHDGLASGVIVISGATLTAIALLDGRATGAIMAAAVVGGALGFFRFNAPPARVFLGDGGAMGLGLLLAMAAIAGQAKTAAAISLVFPLIVLAAPLLDVTGAIVRRLRRGDAPWHADRGHVHHRLAAAGLSPWGVLGVLLGWCAALGAYALLVRLFPRDDTRWTLPAVVTLGSIGLLLVVISAAIIVGRVPRPRNNATKGGENVTAGQSVTTAHDVRGDTPIAR